MCNICIFVEAKYGKTARLPSSDTISTHFMRQPITILLIFLTSLCFGQRDRHYTDFASAIENKDSVKSISINCMHMNELGTDGCDSLPYNIGSLHNLTSLYISESKIKSLPISISQLSRLKELKLNALFYLNYKTELIKLVGLDSLEYLGLRRSNLKLLPSCIGHIKSLRSVDISYNYNLNIYSAFETFQRLTNLESLDLSGIRSFRVIPKKISKLKKIQSIQLNYLKDKFNYKKSFKRLSSLNITSLSLTNNWLNKLPPTITLLKNITYIDLSDNYFESLPVEIFELTNLKHIEFYSNNLTFKTIGSGVSNLINLEKINIGGNLQLDGKEAIISLSMLPKLKDIDFVSCRLDTIPDEIMNFYALEKLNLRSNPNIDFSDLFIKLSSVKTLKYLDISNNKLTALPQEIGLLTSLEFLVIGQNSISTLPEDFFYLTNLKSIYVYGDYNNRIADTELQKIKERLPNCVIISEFQFGF